MKKLNLLLLVVNILVSTQIFYSQAVDRLYLSTASTGRVYDITSLSATPATAIDLPTPLTTPNMSASAANISNLAVGYDAPAGNPTTLVFMHSNNGSGNAVYRNGTAITPALNLPAAIGGLGTNNVPGSYFGYVYGFESLAKTLYRIYPAPASNLGTITGDTDWTNGTTFGTDTFFDYQNYIYTFINNGGSRYLYKISIATRVAVKAIPTAITGTAANVTAIHGMAYLNGDIYIATTTATPTIEIRRISMKTGASTLVATYTSSSNANLDLATVPYYVPFIFNCGGALVQETSPFTAGVPSTKTLRLPISAVYGPDANYDIVVSGTDFTTTTTTRTITSTTTFVDVPITYNGTGANGNRTLTISINGSTTGCTYNAIIERDLDADGIPDVLDLDSDNDGILDIFECPQSVVDVNFSVANGNSQTFSAPAADLGFIFDVYTLDNSFTLTVNGASISSSKLEFQPDQTDNVRFVDGSTYGNGTVPQIYNMTGTAANPLVRIIIHKNGAISMYGSKTSGGPLFPLQLYNGNNFNTIIWNQTSTNTVVVSQAVVGATYISGRGNGVRNGFCDPDNDGISNQFDVDSDNDGCADAIEGSENVKYNQIHALDLPASDPNYAYRGQIKVKYDGVTTGSPSQIISTSAAANGVPQLLNNAGNNLNASTNPSNLAGAVDNTDGTADIGQGIGDSQNIMVNSCAVPFICDTNMYVVQGNPSVLYRIDTSTNPFNFVQIGTGATYPVNATGYNPTDNFIYGINGGANVDKSLIRIDANGTFYNLGVISGLDIAMSYTSGEMDELGNYYIKLAGQNNNKLYKVDVATRTATLIQLSRNVSFIDIAYTQTDGLLWAQDTVSKKLVSINPTNGLVTDLPFVNTLNNYGAWFGSGTGQIYASSNDGTAFVEFNKTTGEAMFISTTQPSTNNDGAHCPTAPIKFDLYCNKLPVTNAGTQLPSNHGITALGRAGADNSNWPMVRQSAWTVLEAKTKGFVVNRVANPATDIANPVEGMMVFDTTAQCLKIYNGTVWSCYSTPACP